MTRPRPSERSNLCKGRAVLLPIVKIDSRSAWFCLVSIPRTAVRHARMCLLGHGQLRDR